LINVNTKEVRPSGLSAIVESSDDAIISEDLNGIIRSWNRGAERMFGYSAEEMLGKHISVLAPPDRTDDFAKILKRIVRGERLEHYRTRRKTKDGRILTVSLTLSPILDEDEKIIGISKTARDVTYGQYFSEIQERLAAIVESSDDAIISKDLNGIIQTWNRGAHRIFGYTAEEAVGRHISLLAAPGRIDEFPRILDRIARGERVDHYLTKRKTKDGRILSVSLTVSPIRDADGRIIGASKIARDVTEQEAYQQALREANDSLRRANADLEHFAYSASHDLQEPLRMISAYSEMLQKRCGDKLGPSGGQYIAYIIEGAARMESLLKSLRIYMQASIRVDEPAPVLDANETLSHTLADLQPHIEVSGASVIAEPLPRVQVHEFQLQQLFQNIIGNAIRYRSGDPPEIHISATSCGNMWQFSIRDNGIGIDPQYREKIFGMFKRLHSATEYPGTGMGLAICQRIVERVGGRIWVDSQPGRGSTFLFTLPAAANDGA
jgi:PAS domain S-box-containing protein